ncbi:MAG: FHA domain-containing protein [Rhodobacterales bacterium]|nr:MAG: FHA domain-containing protein [Rhodobacterales bacterium]
MTLRLILETAPHPQARSEFRLADGQVTIGRGDECDWKIEDPQMFVSRRHCVIVGAGGQYRVTDESRGGVFVDSAMAPLGTGVTAPLHSGMRLRLGDFVIRAELEAAAMAPAAAPAKSGIFGDDFFTPRPEAPPPPRPAGLPDPFDSPREAASVAPMAAPAPAAPAFFDDPFSMDHSSRAVTPAVLAPSAQPAASPLAGDFDFGDFGLPADLSAPAPVLAPTMPAVPAAPTFPAEAAFGDPFAEALPLPVALTPAPIPAAVPMPEPVPAPTPFAVAPPPPPIAADPGVVAALAMSR